MKKSIVAMLCVMNLTNHASEQDKKQERGWLTGWFPSRTSAPSAPSTSPSAPSTPSAPPSDKDRILGLNGMGADSGAKFGMGAAEILSRDLNNAGSSLQGAAIKTGATVLVAVSGYVVRETYYYFRPTPEMRQEKEQRRAELQRKTDEDRQRSEVAKEETCKTKARTAFRECLDSNSDSCTLTSEGYPEQCRPQARRLSFHKEGDSEVAKMALSFAKHAKWEKEEEKDKKDKKK